MRKTTLRHQPKAILSTLLVGLVSLLSMGQAPGSFRGKIIEQTTKQPISGASVRIDKTPFGTVTDTTGAFVITNLPAGMYSVTISNMGFQTKNITEITIAHNKAYYTEIELLEEPVFSACFGGQMANRSGLKMNENEPNLQDDGIAILPPFPCFLSTRRPSTLLETYYFVGRDF